MTGLEALREFKGNNNTKLVGRAMGKQHYLDCLQVMEKSLKALEIIKEKRVDLLYLRCCIEDNQSVERYNEYIRNKTMDYDHEQEITKEEFELLRSVLEWTSQTIRSTHY